MTMQKDVKRFHSKMGLPVSKEPRHLTKSEQKLRYDLIWEELEELREAFLCDNYIDEIDALCDILYVTFGTAVQMGVDLTPFWDEVQRANMQKFGGPHREDGKLGKPEGWQPPDHPAVFVSTYDFPVREIGK